MKNQSVYRLKIWTKETGNIPFKWDIYAQDENDARFLLEDQKRIISNRLTITDCEVLNPSETRAARKRELIAAQRLFA